MFPGDGSSCVGEDSLHALHDLLENCSLSFSFRPASGCLQQKADVVFLLDSSSGIGKDNCHMLEDILMDCREDFAYSCPFCCFHQDACIQKADMVFMMGCEMSTGTTSTN